MFYFSFVSFYMTFNSIEVDPFCWLIGSIFLPLHSNDFYGDKSEILSMVE